MSAASADDVLHTVAVYLPGTDTRVLVTDLAGPPAETIDSAAWHVDQFAKVPASRWLSKVVETRLVTNVPSHQPSD